VLPCTLWNREGYVTAAVQTGPRLAIAAAVATLAFVLYRPDGGHPFQPSESPLVSSQSRLC